LKDMPKDVSKFMFLEMTFRMMKKNDVQYSFKTIGRFLLGFAERFSKRRLAKSLFIFMV
jgi:hypothetical protein